MPVVDVRSLEQEGVSPALIEAYRRAVDVAWAEVAPEIRGLGSRPLMYLQLQNPARDRETVTVSVGMGARFGATSAKNPAALQGALVQHLRERFIPTQDDGTGQEVDADVLKKVIAALENPKYKWRTIPGISREAGVAAEKVMDVLTTSDKIVRSSIPSKSGDVLFTTRARFRESASVGEKLRGAFTNRLD